MSATRGSANSRSVSERGASAKREKPQRTRSASSGGQQPSKRQSRKEREARAASSARHFRLPLLPLSGFSVRKSKTKPQGFKAENRQIFQDKKNPAPGAVGQRSPSQACPPPPQRSQPFLSAKKRPPTSEGLEIKGIDVGQKARKPRGHHSPKSRVPRDRPPPLTS